MTLWLLKVCYLSAIFGKLNYLMSPRKKTATFSLLKTKLTEDCNLEMLSAADDY